MNNIFNGIDAIDEAALESEIAVLESMLVSVDKFDNMSAQIEFDEDNTQFNLITEAFVMESRGPVTVGNGPVSGAATRGAGNLVKKIGEFIAKLFKRNKGKVEVSGADKAALANDVKSSKKGPFNWAHSKFKLLAVGAGVAVTATGVKFAYTKHKLKKDEKAEQSAKKWASLKNGLDSIEVSESGDIKFNFSMDLKAFEKALDKAAPDFDTAVGSVMKYRSDYVNGKKGSKYMVDDKFTKNFMKEQAGRVKDALRAVGKPFDEMYATFSNSGDATSSMTVDEWNVFVENVCKNCVSIADNLTRLNDWMPSHNNEATAKNKRDRLEADFKKSNPDKSDAEIKHAVDATWGTKATDETVDSKGLLLSRTNMWNAELTNIRNIMSDLKNDYLALDDFIKSVNNRVKLGAAQKQPAEQKEDDSAAVDND